MVAAAGGGCLVMVRTRRYRRRRGRAVSAVERCEMKVGKAGVSENRPYVG